MSISVSSHLNPVSQAFHFALEKGEYAKNFVSQLWKGNYGISESLNGRVMKMPASALAGCLILIIGIALSVFSLVCYLRRSNDGSNNLDERPDLLKTNQAIEEVYPKVLTKENPEQEEVYSKVLTEENAEQTEIRPTSRVDQTLAFLSDGFGKMWNYWLWTKAFNDLEKKDS